MKADRHGARATDRAAGWRGGALLLGAAALVLPGCSAIQESRGYIVDPTLTSLVQPQIDNKQSVESTLGRPTFVSQFGNPTWYYVSSITGQRPFSRPKIRQHSVLAVQFDAAGRVAKVDRSGIENVVFLDPNGNKTPTLGRERGFLEDLFGNIGQVGGAGLPGGAGAPGSGPNGQ
ncbi:outer membrane protein assembly factor BamE [Erythrobacter sp. WG]|uniref:outer membrane protein assembly factor BamE n=1 Tax=Erythrobacter sp. WG TaxID=2985510 RepID=UPI0022718B09|nr:outer membrane protein assembly factor BamE [Erythrobacter sp. WG]MCX9147381.1 outer membrane protein assembly factor BamE [Erythrobacter sp. WG]